MSDEHNTPERPRGRLADVIATRGGQGLTEAEAAAVQRWRRQIMHIAAQEMLHLAHDAEGLAASSRAAPLVQAGDIVPRGQDFATVGHLYRSIEAGIAHLADKYGEDWLFVGPPRAQATEKDFRWPELVAVTDAASAQRAIDEILEQGEGPRGAWQDAHFGQFVTMLDELEQLREANRAFDPARPVIALTSGRASGIQTACWSPTRRPGPLWTFSMSATRSCCSPSSGSSRTPRSPRPSSPSSPTPPWP